MTIEELINEWEKDSTINKLEIQEEIIKISSLHFKYQRLLLEENLRLNKTKSEYNKLYLEKYILYTQGAKNTKDKELIKKLPGGAILKSEVEMYLQGDDEIISFSMRVSTCAEKVKFIESALWELRGRNKALTNYVQYERFMAGI